MVLEPGMKVRCIAAANGWDNLRHKYALPVTGGIYTVRDIGPSCSPGWSDLGIRLVELRNPIQPEYGSEPNFSCRRFEPISSTSIEEIRESVRKIFDRKKVDA